MSQHNYGMQRAYKIIKGILFLKGMRQSSTIEELLHFQVWTFLQNWTETNNTGQEARQLHAWRHARSQVRAEALIKVDGIINSSKYHSVFIQNLQASARKQAIMMNFIFQ